MAWEKLLACLVFTRMKPFIKKRKQPKSICIAAFPEQFRRLHPERVFVVGHIGGLWQRAAAVLFDRESLCGNPAPSRETGESIASTVRGGIESGSNEPHDKIADIAPTISSRTKGGGGLGTDAECDGEVIPTLRAGGGQNSHSKHNCDEVIAFDWQSGGDVRLNCSSEHTSGLQRCQTPAVAIGTLVAHSLKADGFDASEDGTGRGTPLVPEIVGTLQADTHPGSYTGQDASTGRIIPEVAQPIRSNNRNNSDAKTEASMHIQSGMAVRRLTPRECCRLQGFPDSYLDIIYHGKPACDGPRYTALGNSMATTVINWIGRRIELVEKLVPLK
jgi:DNA (cytosine-5)-methyltransferase 1